MATPMLEQYERIKARHRDAILLFRLGDFYEMFGQDARDGARLLGLTLTQRQNLPMCGVPHHAARSYIHRLLRQGRKVAVCEQTSTPTGKNLTERDVVEVLSPGAVFDLDYLDPRSSNFVVALAREERNLAVAWCDVSTGELTIAAYPLDEDPDALIRRELARLGPKELLVQESLLEASRSLAQRATPDDETVVNRIPDWGFNREESVRRLCELFSVQSLHGFGIEHHDPALAPVSALITYLEDNARHVLAHLTRLHRHRDTETVILDDATIRNLELVRNLQDGGAGYTLGDVVDECVTAMGSRLIRRWMLAPPRHRDESTARLNRVEVLYRDQSCLQSLRRCLADAYDLERLVGRLGVEKAHPKDVAAIAATARVADTVAALLPDWFGSTPDRATVLDSIAEQQRLTAVAEQIRSTLADDPAVSLTEGGIIRPGFDDTVDELRALRDHSREVLDEYLAEQRAATGIGSLKIKYNRVLGHFFEVPAGQAGRLPAEFIRRQSLANAERFTTARLGELEDQINSAGERADERERELFLSLRAAVAAEIPLLSHLAERLALVDAVAGLAYGATQNGWRRPELVEAPVLEIQGGRHPVVERHLPAGEFVANDITLDGAGTRFALITGPNMAGKSTVLRQTALIALMAHMGSFVPAESAVVGEVDRIFCRVGASDNIARGESTFLVEMNETSNILRNAGPRSLVIMDEVGRGTSTHDGLAIAWAVTEHLLEQTRCRTLFATHYHELAAVSHGAFVALGMAVEHSGDRIVFLKKLVAGAGDRSYGVDVARMAGIPDAVILRAREILAILEGEAAESKEATPRIAPPVAPGSAGDLSDGGERDHQFSRQREELFPPEDLIRGELQGVDPDRLSPREALDLLYRWKSML